MTVPIILPICWSPSGKVRFYNVSKMAMSIDLSICQPLCALGFRLLDKLMHQSNLQYKNVHSHGSPYMQYVF